MIAHRPTVGGLIAFNMLPQRVSGPVIRMAQLWQEFQQVRISVQRLGDVLNYPTEPGSVSRAALPALRGAVRFEDLRFRYGPEGPWTLDGIDLDIPAGTTLGIVGSAVRQCDRIITLENGRIREAGTHVELLALGGRYADLYRRQMGTREQPV